MAADTTPKPWEIQLPAMADASVNYDMELGSDFFAAADHADMTGGNIHARVELIPAGNDWRVKLQCQGVVDTLCDRCQAPMEVEVDDEYEAPLQPSPGGIVPPGDDSDAFFYDSTTGIADLLRPLADTIALNLGISHTHPEGQCDPEVEAALDHRSLEANTPLADALGSLNLESQNQTDQAR